MTTTPTDVAQLAANTIKALTMDAVQKANSGHPGMPMGMADIATVVWSEFLVVDPDHPTWTDRDRFVVSNGHGSMLLYALLHLNGFPLTMDDLQSFRQWGSPTPGHPEIDRHLGIEMTTGPLGQGFGTSVGMAMAEAHLRHRLGADLVDHRTFVLCSDGDLMEGISAETASLAGHLGLGRLVCFYDDNHISIDGDTAITFTEDVPARFAAAGWHTVQVDGHDRRAIAEATRASLAVEDRPSLVICRTHIAHGAPTKQDTAGAHGAPLGEEEIHRTKEAMGWPVDRPFHVPDEVRAFFQEAMERGKAEHRAWEERRDAAFDADPNLGETFESFFGTPAVRLEDPGFEAGSSLATRAASGRLFDQIATKLPGFLGGAADLVESTKTEIGFSGSFSRTDRTGRNIHFGIREHAMGTIVNGLALHGGLRPYGATFFVFSDYMRPAVRLSALMEIPSIWVYTHDSVFLGEDGPTHQPVEHLMSLRAMPHMWVVRPADAGETVEAWEMALNRTGGPTALVLTRQGLPVLDRAGRTGGVAKGGYILRDGSDAVLVATGSEVALALAAAEVLAAEDLSLRVVSMPCWEAFSEQDAGYRASVLGSSVLGSSVLGSSVLGEPLPVASIEAGATLGWERFTGRAGLRIGIDRFGASAPAAVIAEQLGFTAEGVAKRVKEWFDGLPSGDRPPT